MIRSTRLSIGGDPPSRASRLSKTSLLANRRTSDKAARGRKGGRGKCRVCASDRQSEIDGAIVAGESFRSLENRFGISATALRRHKTQHLSPALVRVQKVRALRGARTLVERLGDLVAKAEQILEAAIANSNASQALAAIREVRATIELEGRATGELKERPSVSVNLQTSAEWVAARSAVTEVLASHPELSRELAQKLRQLEA